MEVNIEPIHQDTRTSIELQLCKGEGEGGEILIFFLPINRNRLAEHYLTHVIVMIMVNIPTEVGPARSRNIGFVTNSRS